MWIIKLRPQVSKRRPGRWAESGQQHGGIFARDVCILRRRHAPAKVGWETLPQEGSCFPSPSLACPKFLHEIRHAGRTDSMKFRCKIQSLIRLHRTIYPKADGLAFVQR